MHYKWLIAIMGPTASGKTNVAIQLARHFKASIISVDSRQIFSELSIGTAKPTDEELSLAPHYLISTHSISQQITAAAYADEAVNQLDKIFSESDIAIAAGGSTLYFKALLEGIDEFPEVTAEAKETVAVLNKERGLEGLQSLLKEKDPVYYSAVDIHNPRRLIRALEVCLSSAQPYSSFLGKGNSKRNFNVIKIGLDLPREELYQRINNRCDEMLQQGLLEEVKTVIPYREHQALQTVGYKEFFDYIDGKYSYEEAVELFKQHTRNYAKRQLTWFRADSEITWFSPDDLSGMISHIEAKVKG